MEYQVLCNIEGFTVSNRPDVLIYTVEDVEDTIRDCKILKCKLLMKLNYWASISFTIKSFFSVNYSKYLTVNISYILLSNFFHFESLKSIELGEINLGYVQEGSPRARQKATSNARRSWFVEQTTGDEELAKIYCG